MKNWNSLKDNQCPMCGYSLADAKGNRRRYCINKQCNFQITNNKLEEILDNFRRDKMKEEMEGFGLE